MNHSTARARDTRRVFHHRATTMQAEPSTVAPLNMGDFAVAMEQATTRINHHGGQLGLILFALDNLQGLCSRAGNDSVDALLEQLGLHLARRVRSDDQLGRISKGEFALLAPGMELSEVTGCAVKLRHLISDFHFNRTGPICASFGVTHFLRGEPLQLLESRARHALDRARAAGGNRVSAVRAV